MPLENMVHMVTTLMQVGYARAWVSPNDDVLLIGGVYPIHVGVGRVWFLMQNEVDKRHQ